MKRWYVIQIKHKCEELAESNLQNQKFETYNPMTVEVRIHKGQPMNVECPLFSGYMFVRFDIEQDRWKAISSTKGVYKLLTATDTRCTPLPAGFIEELRRKEGKDGCITEDKAVTALREFVIGEELQVDSGVFKGFTGICQRVKGDKIVILLSLLGGKTAVELPKVGASRIHSSDTEVR